MPITDFKQVEFVPVHKMKLEKPSIIIAGQVADMDGESVKNFAPFKFHIDDETDISDVQFVLINHLGISKDDIGYFTAGLSMKQREPTEKLSDIFGDKVKEGDQYRFVRKEIMQCTVWPAGYDEKREERFSKMFDGPKGYKSKSSADEGEKLN